MRLYGARLGQPERRRLAWLATKSPVCQTIRDLMGQHAVHGSRATMKFDASTRMQDAMASKLIHDEGPPWRASATGPFAARRQDGPTSAGAAEVMAASRRSTNGAAAFGADSSAATVPCFQRCLEDMKRRGLISDRAVRHAGQKRRSASAKAPAKARNVHRLASRRDAAEAGGLKKGTPVSTFLDRRKGARNGPVRRRRLRHARRPPSIMPASSTSYIRRQERPARSSASNMAEQYARAPVAFACKAYGFGNRGYGEGNGIALPARLQTPDGQLR